MAQNRVVGLIVVSIPVIPAVGEIADHIPTATDPGIASSPPLAHHAVFRNFLFAFAVPSTGGEVLGLDGHLPHGGEVQREFVGSGAASVGRAPLLALSVFGFEGVLVGRAVYRGVRGEGKGFLPLVLPVYRLNFPPK